MATAASVVGTRAKVYVSEGWKEPLVIFSGFVADPGSRKSAAMSVSRVPLVRLQESAEMEYAYRKEEYDREKRRYDALGKKAAADHEPPVEPDKRHYYLEDSTLEAAMAIHAQEPSKNGFVMIYDELAELIDGFDQYKSKGGSDRKKVLRFFNGSDIKTDRKTQKSSCFIPESAISITGAIQEGTLKRLISTSKDVDGMWDRFLWCFPRFVSVRQRGNPVDITEYLKWIYQELDSIPEQSYYLSDTARRILTEFEFWIEDQRHEVSQPVFLAYSKLPGLSARLALFLHLIDAVVEHRPIVPTISAATMQRAIKLMNYYISQIHLLHGRASEHNLDSKLVGIIELSKDKGAVSTRDIQRKRIAKNTEEASNLLSVLIERGLGNTSQGARGQTLWTYDPNALTTDRETFRIPSELVTEAKNESIPCREPVSADFSPVTLETVEVRNEPRFDASNLPMQSREREAMPVTSPAGIPAQRAAMESESSRCGSTTDGEVLAGQSSTVGAGSEYPFSEGDRVIDSVTGLESTVAEVMDDGDGTVVYFLNGSVNDYRAAEQLSKPLDVASTLDWRGFQVGDFVECVFPEWMDERSRKESAKMKEAPYGARGTVKELVVWDLKFGGKVVPAAVVEFEFGTKRLALDQLMRLI
ncbi:MAG: YfjI family protein [Leptolyngbya sp. Prado105]|nr:YfjI family protein [Leptolyngbya sp. Prado105]